MEQKDFFSQMKGLQSLSFQKPPYILASGNVVGKKEGEGPLGKEFDVICEDDKFGADNWEDAESTLQKDAVALALGKAGLEAKDIRYIFAGDLLGQNIATSFGLMDYEIPLFGLYGACSTAGESMALGAMCVAAGYAKNVLTLTSSHFASAEKQFRFPLEYANQRPLSATWTVTGSGAFVLSTTRSKARITGITTGKIVDYGVKDSMNMGAAMAMAALDTIVTNFKDLGVDERYYDRIITGDLGTVGRRLLLDYDKIITGDLGKVGKEILIKLLREKGIDIAEIHTDCGIEIFDCEEQGTPSGGSGCGCSAVTLSAYFLKQVEKGALKRILFVPTGALLSTVSFNEGQSVPGIAHAIVIEHA